MPPRSALGSRYRGWVAEVLMMSKPDYFLRIAVAALQAYEGLYIKSLASLPGVATITSQIAMKNVKIAGRIPM
jgi:DNA-binding Lrp family transcriptional regulator